MKLGVSKKTLLLIAGGIWLIAGFRVMSLGIQDVFSGRNHLIPDFTVATLVFLAFFKFVFYPMVRKHTVRIISKIEEKPFILSFFDIKGYLIMTFMITLGVTLRNSHIFKPEYIGTFYMGLGLALFIAGILFSYHSFNYTITLAKYAPRKSEE